jgi:hypothetical protein
VFVEYTLLYISLLKHKGFAMIRLSQLFTLGVKCRGVREVSSAIYSGIFASNEPCYGQVTNRHYATAQQGIHLIFFLIFLYFLSYKSAGRLINAKVVGFVG